MEVVLYPSLVQNPGLYFELEMALFKYIMLRFLNVIICILINNPASQLLGLPGCPGQAI